LALKAKHEIDKVNFETKISELQSQLKNNDEDRVDKSKKEKDGVKKVTQGPTEFANPAALLKLRLQKVINSNKEKK